MFTKEQLVKTICKKLKIEFKYEFFDNIKSPDKHNATVSKIFLKEIATKLGINDPYSGKKDLAKLICNYLNIEECQIGIGKDIGDNAQISKKYLEKLLGEL